MLDRDLLERVALDKVCACLYYDLADNIDIASDAELVVIVWGLHECEDEQ